MLAIRFSSFLRERLLGKILSYITIYSGDAREQNAKAIIWLKGRENAKMWAIESKVKRLKTVDIELLLKLKNAETLALNFQSVNLILSGYRKCKPNTTSSKVKLYLWQNWCFLIFWHCKQKQVQVFLIHLL